HYNKSGGPFEGPPFLHLLPTSPALPSLVEWAVRGYSSTAKALQMHRAVLDEDEASAKLIGAVLQSETGMRIRR
ncbi:MAG: hypothetical protein ACRD06_00455, partial [Terriglobia bacterium]